METPGTSMSIVTFATVLETYTVSPADGTAPSSQFAESVQLPEPPVHTHVAPCKANTPNPHALASIRIFLQSKCPSTFSTAILYLLFRSGASRPIKKTRL